jgi:hypothetical protein
MEVSLSSAGNAPACALDTVNRPTWSQADTVRLYERLHGWTDPGERAAVELAGAASWISAWVRAAPLR